MKINEDFQAAVDAICRGAERALKNAGAPLGLLAHNEEDRVPTCVIVDAEVDGARALGEYLTARGLLVWTTPSGEEALRIIQRVQPALVMVDLKPIGIGGGSLLACIRRFSPRSRVVILTGWGAEYLDYFVREFRVDACCLKPASVDTVRQAIGKTLNMLSLIDG